MSINSWYSPEEIGTLFLDCRKTADMDMTDGEYQILCEALSYAPKDILDRIKQEVFLVVLSHERNNRIQPACYLSMEASDLRGKSALLFLSPSVFADTGPCYPTLPILHEIAHHVLGHKNPHDPDERNRHDGEANDQAAKWIAAAPINRGRHKAEGGKQLKFGEGGRMNKAEGIMSLRQFLSASDLNAPMADWYVGITNDPYRRVFIEHKVPLDYKAHKCIRVPSVDIAREIEGFFIEVLKTDGGQGGGDEEACFVYAFLKTEGTNPPLR